jgi:hypothetical protein
MRWAVTAFASLWWLVVIACDDREETISHLRLNFVNNTDSLVCYAYGSRPESIAQDNCSAPIAPMAETTWAPDCYSLHEVSPFALVDEASGDVIYAREATCGEWIDAGQTITIDREGDEFLVTDGFGD